MARRRSIPDTIDTTFFSGVTPLWVPPNRSQIPSKYHDAVLELAKWAGPSWPDNEETDFFLIRNVVIESCEAWSKHDWGRDQLWIAERRDDARLLAASDKMSALFKRLLGANRLKRLKVRFVTILLMRLQIEIRRTLTNGDLIDAFDHSLVYLTNSIEARDNFPATFGAIEYDAIPNSLPAVSVAVALCIADRITFFRKDGHAKGTLHNPHPPSLSPDLPWKAIALFASANDATSDDLLSESSVQTRVESLAKSVARLSWTPSK